MKKNAVFPQYWIFMQSGSVAALWYRHPITNDETGVYLQGFTPLPVISGSMPGSAAPFGLPNNQPGSPSPFQNIANDIQTLGRISRTFSGGSIALSGGSATFPAGSI